MNDRYLSIKEVSRVIGVTPLTLRNWDKRGVLVAYRNPINNYRTYRYSDVADFIAEMRRAGAPPSGEPLKLAVTVED